MNSRYFSDVKEYLHDKMEKIFIKTLAMQLIIALLIGLEIFCCLKY